LSPPSSSPQSVPSAWSPSIPPVVEIHREVTRGVTGVLALQEAIIPLVAQWPGRAGQQVLARRRGEGLASAVPLFKADVRVARRGRDFVIPGNGVESQVNVEHACVCLVAAGEAYVCGCAWGHRPHPIPDSLVPLSRAQRGQVCVVGAGLIVEGRVPRRADQRPAPAVGGHVAVNLDRVLAPGAIRVNGVDAIAGGAPVLEDVQAGCGVALGAGLCRQQQGPQKSQGQDSE